ncbi:MAG: DNA repair protein RecO [Candidatus Shapirobacteria bacterium]
MPRYFSTTAIVINKKSVKESDLLITLLTPSLGKIVAIAKGVKNIKSTRLGSLQLGNLIKAHFYSKNNFLWLSESQTIVSFLQTDKSLAQLNLLFYFLEIINHFIAENQNIEGVFDISCHLVDAINRNQVKTYIQNEILLLHTLGFGTSEDITQSFNQKNYRACQKLLKNTFESIIEHPLQSNKLFR